MMYKACPRCGKIHPYGYKCTVGMTYAGGKERELRNTYQWHKKAEEIKERANYLCEVCKDKGEYTYKGLEVHHIVKVRERPDLLLDNENLVCLCVRHHKMADAGQISINYLQSLAEKRERDSPGGVD